MNKSFRSQEIRFSIVYKYPNNNKLSFRLKYFKYIKKTTSKSSNNTVSNQSFKGILSILLPVEIIILVPLFPGLS